MHRAVWMSLELIQHLTDRPVVSYRLLDGVNADEAIVAVESGEKDAPVLRAGEGQAAARRKGPRHCSHNGAGACVRPRFHHPPTWKTRTPRAHKNPRKAKMSELN